MSRYYSINISASDGTALTDSTGLALVGYGLYPVPDLPDLSGLITDRTAADVQRVQALAKIGWADMTTAERGEWMGSAGYGGYLTDSNGAVLTDSEGNDLYSYFTALTADLKGAYNQSDLQRVEAAAAGLAAYLSYYEYITGYAATGTDWDESGVYQESILEQYLANVRGIRDALELVDALPGSMSNLTYRGANQIEAALISAKTAINNTKSAWLYSGDVYAGEV